MKSVKVILIFSVLVLCSSSLFAQNVHDQFFSILSNENEDFSYENADAWADQLKKLVQSESTGTMPAAFTLDDRFKTRFPQISKKLEHIAKVYRQFKVEHSDSKWFENRLIEYIDEAEGLVAEVDWLNLPCIEPDQLAGLQYIFDSASAQSILAADVQNDVLPLSRKAGGLEPANHAGMAPWNYSHRDPRTKDAVYIPAYHSITIHHSDTGTDTRPGRIQSMHTDGNGWDDVGYHLIIAQDSDTGAWQLYQGREFQFRGAHAGATLRGKPSPNAGRLGIVIAGNFTEQQPPEEALTVLKNAVASLCNENSRVCQVWGARGVPIRIQKIEGHRDCKSTECPGHHMYPVVDALDELYGSKPLQLLEHLETGALEDELGLTPAVKH